jgi:uncharacterized protein (TIGR01777 family)
MKILVSGASGLIGSALVSTLASDGHEILRLSHSDSDGDATTATWQPENGDFPDAQKAKLQGVEAAFHLAGENVFGRWDEDKKRAIRDSRVASTRILSEALAALSPRPRVLISASAVGYYGSRGAEALNENSAPGDDFLADVCRDWERVADAARDAGIRVAHPRFGVVLSKDGGALQKMLLPFSLGLGGPIGTGKQFFSWIALEDVIGGLRFLLENENAAGAFNFVAPEAVKNHTFVRALGRVLQRPAVVPLPASALELAFGKESAGQTLLASQRAVPEKLLAHGFEFQHSKLEDALRAILNDELD